MNPLQPFPPQVLNVVPKSFRVELKLNEEIYLNLTLSNTTNFLVTFKVKTTARDRYGVRPTQGYIPAGKSKTCEIVLAKMKEFPDPSDAKLFKDKFLVQSLVIPNEVEDLTKFWKEKEREHNPKKEQYAYHDQKIKCRLTLPPSQQPLQLQQPPMQPQLPQVQPPPDSVEGKSIDGMNQSDIIGNVGTTGGLNEQDRLKKSNEKIGNEERVRVGERGISVGGESRATSVGGISERNGRNEVRGERDGNEKAERDRSRDRGTGVGSSVGGEKIVISNKPNANSGSSNANGLNPSVGTQNLGLGNGTISIPSGNNRENIPRPEGFTGGDSREGSRKQDSDELVSQVAKLTMEHEKRKAEVREYLEKVSTLEKENQQLKRTIQELQSSSNSGSEVKDVKSDDSMRRRKTPFVDEKQSEKKKATKEKNVEDAEEVGGIRFQYWELLLLVLVFFVLGRIFS